MTFDADFFSAFDPYPIFYNTMKAPSTYRTFVPSYEFSFNFDPESEGVSVVGDFVSLLRPTPRAKMNKPKNISPFPDSGVHRYTTRI